MFPFLNRKSVKKRGLEDTVASSELSGESNGAAESTEKVQTELSFHPTWNVPKENEYVYRFLNNDLAPLLPNQLSLAGVEWKKGERGNVDVTAFVRSSLNLSVQLGKVELLLLNDKKELAAKRTFDFAALGDLPPRSSRPWVFHFPADTIEEAVELPEDGWTLAFNLQSMKGHALDLEPSWEESLTDEKKAELRRIVDSLPEVGETELNFMGLSASYGEEGDLRATIFIRNGHSKNIQLEQLPLEVIDAAGDLVAQGGFHVNLEVKANTTKPWTFIFPKQNVVKENADLSRWQARVPQDA